MKRIVVSMVLGIALIQPALPAVAVTSGSACKTVGQTVTSGSKTLICAQVGKKKLWVAVPTPVKAPSPTKSPSTGAGVIITPVPGKTEVLPAVGNCYLLTYEQTAPKSSDARPVSCDQSHTTETYRVGTWQSPDSPYAISDVAISDVVRPVCTPTGIPTNTILTTYVFFLPSQSEWDQGKRFIRCDWVSVSDKNSVKSLVSWIGTAPVRPFQEATCTVDSSGGGSWGTSSYKTGSYGFLVRNSSLDRDAANVLVTVTVNYPSYPSEKFFVEISKIPAGQTVGAGVTESIKPETPSGYSYSTKCDSVAKQAPSALITSQDFQPIIFTDFGNFSTPAGLEMKASFRNDYATPIRCKNDGISCKVYVAMYTSDGRLRGGFITTIDGTVVYPGEIGTFSMTYDDYPHTGNMRLYKFWIQEPR